MKQIIGFVPMRCGSKGIPMKNIKNLCGKPLCYYVLNALMKSKKIDLIYVSTDCNEIENIVNGFSFNKVIVIKRSKKNASDYASSESAMIEFIKSHSINPSSIIFFTQVTSPLLTHKDVDGGIELFNDKKNDTVLSAVKFNRFFWSDNGVPLNYDPLNRPTRQKMKDFYVENGAFYISKVKDIVKHKTRISGRIGIFPMHEDSLIEIDELNDFIQMEKIIENR